MTIKKDNAQPLYLQIAKLIEEKIYNGELTTGQKIYTEVELMNLYNVSRVTVRQVFRELLDKGLIERKQGKGTFVKYNHLSHQLYSPKGLFETLLEAGYTPETVLLDFTSVVPPKAVSEALNISPGKKVIKFDRIYYVKSDPIVFSRFYLSPLLDEIITREDAEHHPIFDLINKKSEFKVGKIHFEIFSEDCPKDVQNIFKQNGNKVILGQERVLYATTNEPLEYSLYWIRPNSIRFTFDAQVGTRSPDIYEFNIKSK
ncbi:GntR family transcriptional regulator [Bacillus rubiinfantis]|uniref:GntR family transcriptional regulator n=1 Tax=Bacillus rubiinfantis TaxID=1499680 RepID=UPI000693DC15|nr:GntR family transcriptional regulator [Bacillus rubiinfantis]